MTRLSVNIIINRTNIINDKNWSKMNSYSIKNQINFNEFILSSNNFKNNNL